MLGKAVIEFVRYQNPGSLHAGLLLRQCTGKDGSVDGCGEIRVVVNNYHRSLAPQLGRNLNQIMSGSRGNAPPGRGSTGQINLRQSLILG